MNPDAIYYGRGPFTAQDILDVRMVADPFHLLDCAMTSEGGSALVLARADRVADLPHKPVYVLGGTSDHFGPSYRHAPAWDLTGRDADGIPNGLVGRRAARRAFATAGLGPTTSTCASSTTRSRSRSSASSRRSGSAARARAATS